MPHLHPHHLEHTLDSDLKTLASDSLMQVSLTQILLLILTLFVHLFQTRSLVVLTSLELTMKLRRPSNSSPPVFIFQAHRLLSF